MKTQGGPLVETVETDSRAATKNLETVVLTYLGDATSWDVYVDVPAEWVASTTTLRVYGRVDGERIPIAALTLDEVGPVSTPLSALACSVRGQPVAAVEVAIFNTGETLSDGKFKLRAWLGDEPAVVAAAPNLQRVASMPVRLFDGISDIGTSTRPLITRALRPGRTFSAVSSLTSTNPGTTVVHAALWSSNTHAFDAELLRISISHSRGVTGSPPPALMFFVVCFDTRTGGTAAATASWDGNDSIDAQVCTLYTTPAISATHPLLFAATVDSSTSGMIVWEPSAGGPPLRLPKNVARGIAVCSVFGGGDGATASDVIVTVQWIETP